MATTPTINVEALKSEIRSAIINKKHNACPMAVRLAWHASGTYSKEDKTGGSDGATMRFAPESEDDANAGFEN
jgi:catalase (peroxidase I)